MSTSDACCIADAPTMWMQLHLLTIAGHADSSQQYAVPLTIVAHHRRKRCDVQWGLEDAHGCRCSPQMNAALLMQLSCYTGLPTEAEHADHVYNALESGCESQAESFWPWHALA